MKFDSTLVQTCIPSPLGDILLAASATGLAGLWFAQGQRYLPQELASPLLASPAALTPEATGFAADSSASAPRGVKPAGAAFSRLAPHWPSAPDHPLLRQASGQLNDYFSGRRRHFELPLDLSSGTVFQQAVWQALRDIAQGGTVSYTDIAQRLGKPGAVRAVGAAIGRNPVSIIVPCHRVMGSNGSLTGYAGGLERKSALLRLEGVL